MAQFEVALINDESGKLQVKDFEQVKGALIEVLNGLELPSGVDGANYVSVKEQRAKLNKVSKLLNEQKTEIRQKALSIVATAESQIKELVAMANDKSVVADDMIKAYEAEMDLLKIKKANAIWAELKDLNTQHISFDAILEVIGAKWTNATFTETMIKDGITAFYKKVDDDIAMIKSAFPDYYQFVIDYYLKSFDMLQATKEGKQAWELANKHIDNGMPFSEGEIVDNQKLLEATNETFVITFTIKTTKLMLEKLQNFINLKGIEVISAKKGE